MARTGKRLKAARESIDRETLYPAREAIRLVKAAASTGFDETVEVAVGLGVDPRHADQMVRGVVALPNGTGKSVRVAVFAKGDKVEEATAGGRRHGGRRGSRRKGGERRHRVRPVHRHAGHDAGGRQAREDPGGRVVSCRTPSSAP